MLENGNIPRGGKIGHALLIAVLVVTCQVTLAAPSPNFTFQQLSVSDGLIQGSVQAIAQDRHGFMWFGTQQGLSRYDGVHFKTYLHDPGDANSLPGDWIWDLHVDHKGQLWVGTHNHGLARYDEQLDGFHRFAPGRRVRQIAEDSEGLFWLALEQDGAATFNPQTAELSLIAGDFAEPITSKAVLTDKFSNVWLGTNKGLMRRDPIGRQFTKVPGIPTEVEITALASDSVSLWAAGEEHGVYRIDTSVQEVQHLKATPGLVDGLESNRIRAISIDHLGNAWLGHDTHGLNRYTAGGDMNAIRARAGIRQALIDDHIRAIFEDRNGLIWIGTVNGISLLNRISNGFVTFSESTDPATSLSGNWIANFVEKSPTEFWVATYGDGINLVDLKSSRVTSVQHQPGNDQSLSEDTVMALELLPNGDLWTGTRFQGASVLQTDGTWRHYRHNPDDAESLSHNTISDLYLDRNGGLWLASMGGGLNRYQADTDSFVRFTMSTPVSICSNKILHVFQDSANALWLGTYDAGLCRIDLTTGAVTHFEHDPADETSISSDVAWLVTEDKFGNLWVGTASSGLNVWLAQDRADRVTKFHRLNIATGMSSNVVYAMESDSQGRLWVGSNRGLTRYTFHADNPTLTPEKRHFTTDDGLPGNEFNFSASLRGTNGKLIFGTTDGVTTFQPETQNDQRPAPSIALTEFRKMNEPVRFNLDTPDFTVEYSDKLIQFNYAALDYAAPRRIRYQHYLEGFEEHWVDDGNLSQASYTNLEPGQYAFNVRAIREGDTWPDSGLRIPVTVNAPIWATSWAYASYVVLLALFALLVQRSWNRRLYNAKELAAVNVALRAEVAERQKQESALQQVQQQAQQYLDIAEVPIIALNAAGGVSMINQKGARLIGLPEEQILGRNFAASFVPTDAHTDFLKTLNEIDVYGYSESRLTSYDGTERLIAWHNVRLSAADNPPNGILMSGSDITQMRKLESQLRDGQKMEALGTLARGVAHDFNNILSAILGYSELTRSQLNREERAHGYLEKLESSVSRAKEIVASILTFGRAQQLPITLIDLRTAIIDALYLVRPIIPANVRLIENIDQVAGPVLANPAHITQMILNLCTNACQAMAEKGGDVIVNLQNRVITEDQARASGKLKAGPHVSIMVTDTGPGMDDYTLSRIFEPFFTTRAPGEGSGLGLSVVHGVVSQIGGSVDVSSEANQGTRFEITLPCLTDEPLPTPEAESNHTQSLGGDETILFVDDEIEVTAIAELSLSNRGYTVVTANCAEDALATLGQHSVSLMITDQTMPGMRGEELAKEAKQLYPHLPIILISGADQPDNAAVDAFLTKPYANEALVTKIRSLLQTATS